MMRFKNEWSFPSLDFDGIQGPELQIKLSRVLYSLELLKIQNHSDSFIGFQQRGLVVNRTAA